MGEVTSDIGGQLGDRWIASRPLLGRRAGDDPAQVAAGIADKFTEHDTQLVPGEFFGRPGYVRLGFGIEQAPLREALRRLGVALDAV